jgi:hypothetical protein
VEVEGDGSGVLLAIRLESPRHLAFGALADRYVVVDFTGKRLLSLVETESSRWSDYVWDDGKGAYNAYRETIDFGAVESISIWLQNLPPGRETRCGIGPIRALSLGTGLVKNPKLIVAGEALEFPVEIASGSWIEANGPEDCAVYGSKGEPLGKVTPRGQWPELPAGTALIQFRCEGREDFQPRARLTVFAHGPAL